MLQLQPEHRGNKSFWLCLMPGRYVFHPDAQKQLISLLSSWTSLKIHSWGEVWDPDLLFSLCRSSSFLYPFLSLPPWLSANS